MRPGDADGSARVVAVPDLHDRGHHRAAPGPRRAGGLPDRPATPPATAPDRWRAGRDRVAGAAVSGSTPARWDLPERAATGGVVAAVGERDRRAGGQQLAVGHAADPDDAAQRAAAPATDRRAPAVDAQPT